MYTHTGHTDRENTPDTGTHRYDESYSRASVLETLLTAQTRLVLQTAAYRRQKRKKHADRHENIDDSGNPIRILF